MMNKADKSKGVFSRVKNNTPCVFISHKKDDEEKALVIGNFLMEKLHYDIYLDVFDIELREAVSTENDKKIVESIKRGIKLSDILLCIVSDKTKLSWWVPYEIGVAEENDISIVSLKTKDIDDFPSFLKTQTILNTIDDLVEYMLKKGRYGGLFYSKDKKDHLVSGGVGTLEEFFEKE